MRPDQPHGMSPTFTEDSDYAWRPVRVVSYDASTKKYKIIIEGTGKPKYVTRLSLLFYAEDPELFK